MKAIIWDKEKNAILLKERGVCFEDVEAALECGGLLDMIEHHNQVKYAHQRIMIICLNNYVYTVPCVETKENVHLIMVIPSRKLTKKYLGVDDED